ncbi:MAG: hypothetical protein ACRD6X_08405 [Pyrinomonadaceae bacterium]
MRCQFCETETPKNSRFCGNCGKILINEVGRIDSHCPYCLIELAKRPLAKTRCKHCNQNIYSRIRPFDRQKVLLTETETEIVELQWATLNGTLSNYLANKERKTEIRQQLSNKLGREPFRYEIDKEYLKQENPFRLEKTFETYRNNSDLFAGWEWLSPKQTRSCIYCIAMDGKRFSFEISFESLIRCENEYCRCTMIAVIAGVDRPHRTIGGEWFNGLCDEDQLQMLGQQRFREYKNGRSLEDILEL